MIIIHCIKKNIKYMHLFKFGHKYRLSFTRQQVFGDIILSLDRIKKRLIVSSVFDPLKVIFRIESWNIRSIILKKIYKHFSDGQPGSYALADFPEAIHLHLELLEEKHKLVIPLFDRSRDTSCDYHKLELCATEWAKLLAEFKSG